MKFSSFILFFFIVLFSSCDEKKKVPVWEGSPVSEDVTFVNSNVTEFKVDSKTINVPFVEKGGVKYVNVKVNGLGFEMIFDTGCSLTLISVAEANYLYEKGYLTREDIIGTSHSQIADGSIVENMMINLKDVVIDDKIHCNNVTATVSNNAQGPLLLGNEILNRAAEYTVDNQNKTINFKLK